MEPDNMSSPTDDEGNSDQDDMSAEEEPSATTEKKSKQPTRKDKRPRQRQPKEKKKTSKRKKSSSSDNEDENPKSGKRRRKDKKNPDPDLSLAENILQNAPARKKTRINEKGRNIPEIGNLGGLPGDIFTKRNKGEYANISIQLLQRQRPLLSTKLIVDAMELVAANNFQQASKLLWIDQEVKQHGLDLIYKLIGRWLEEYSFPVPDEYTQYDFSDLDENLVKWVKVSHSDPIDARFRIVGLGNNEFGTVVPEEWIDREFDNAEQCHKEMDTLAWRKEKPPVNYCLTFGLIKEDKTNWFSASDAISCPQKLSKPTDYVIGFVNNAHILEKVKDHNHWDKLKEMYTKSQQENIEKLRFRVWYTKEASALVITDLESNETIRAQLTRGSTSRLYSTLQKGIRRGRKNYDFVGEIVDKLAMCSPIHLPEQQFKKVSAHRQICWRLFITALEDVDLYAPSQNCDYVSLPELVCLSLICTCDPDLLLPSSIVTRLKKTAQGLAYQDEKLGKWRGVENGSLDWITKSGKDRPTPVVDIKNSLVVACATMKMMEGDRKLLQKYCTILDGSPKLTPLSFPVKNPSDNEEATKTEIAGVDMHCYPNLLLHVQASIPPYTFTTKEISSYIWENSSRINVRDKSMKLSTKWLNEISKIQKHYITPLTYEHVKHLEVQQPLEPEQNQYEVLEEQAASYEIGRAAFLLLFGFPIVIARTKKYPSMEVMVSGTTEDPFVVKEKRKEEKHEMQVVTDEEQKKYAIKHYLEKTGAERKQITLPLPPFGYQWKFAQKKVNIHVKSENEFVVEGETIKPFGGATLVQPIQKRASQGVPKALEDLILQIMGKSGFEVNILCRESPNAPKQCYNWSDLFKKKSTISFSTWKSILTQLHRTEVEIGPVDRLGGKLQRAISYKDEGYQWRIMNGLCYLYSSVVKPSGQFKFQITRDKPEYFHMIDQVKSILESHSTNIFTTSPATPTIKTILWDHQTQSSKQIAHGLLHDGKRGFGDASHVGAGKTLIALSVMAELYPHRDKHGAFLILVPFNQLLKTWKDEIEKHTSGFHVMEQQSNGTINGKVRSNTIVITTMGRCRDHPLDFPWTLVVIDECLSVQNKDALQTEEAWRQSIMSRFGVVMMSATFFRSRFDKLYYMLQMLQSHYPPSKQYLPILLSEHIICNIRTNTRKWTTTIYKFALKKSVRDVYTSIQQSPNKDNKDKYMQLEKLIRNQVDYVSLFDQRIKMLTTPTRSPPCKCLIYAQSKNEADQLANRLENVGRYPDISKTHVVVSYSEGTFGLNDLVPFNTILTRVPEPDKVPQMKGRLDRPGQLANELHLEMILLEDTIEEALVFRLEMCNYFFRKYIMPLAEFYDKAVACGKL